MPAQHVNVILYTKHTHEVEIFEPNGLQASDEFGGQELYAALRERFMKVLGIKGRLHTPISYCPKKLYVFQSLETDEKGLWKTEGYCAVWSIWYIEQRLSNPTLTTRQTVTLAMDALVDIGSLRHFIWNYDRYMKRAVKKHI